LPKYFYQTVPIILYIRTVTYILILFLKYVEYYQDGGSGHIVTVYENLINLSGSVQEIFFYVHVIMSFYHI